MCKCVVCLSWWICPFDIRVAPLIKHHHHVSPAATSTQQLHTLEPLPRADEYGALAHGLALMACVYMVVCVWWVWLLREEAGMTKGEAKGL